MTSTPSISRSLSSVLIPPFISRIHRAISCTCAWECSRMRSFTMPTGAGRHQHPGQLRSRGHDPSAGRRLVRPHGGMSSPGSSLCVRRSHGFTAPSRSPISSKRVFRPSSATSAGAFIAARTAFVLPAAIALGLAVGIPAIFVADPGSAVLVFHPPRSPQAGDAGNRRAGPGSRSLVHSDASRRRRRERLFFEPLVAVAAGSGAANGLHLLDIHVAGPRCV